MAAGDAASPRRAATHVTLTARRGSCDVQRRTALPNAAPRRSARPFPRGPQKQTPLRWLLAGAVHGFGELEGGGFEFLVGGAEGVEAGAGFEHFAEAGGFVADFFELGGVEEVG